MGKKFVFLFASVFVALLCASTARAQDDYRRFEFFVGYSHNRVDVGPVEDFDPDDDIEFSDIFDEREGFNGFNASVTGNFSRYLGAKFDYSYHQKSFGFGGDNTTIRLHNILGGIQVKDNSTETTWKPFAHALIGVGRTSADLTEFDNTLEDFGSQTDAAQLPLRHRHRFPHLQTTRGKSTKAQNGRKVFCAFCASLWLGRKAEPLCTNESIIHEFVGPFRPKVLDRRSDPSYPLASIRTIS